MARNALLTTILAGLAAAGCGERSEETMCLQVDAEAACPDVADVDPSDLSHGSYCDLEATRVLEFDSRLAGGLGGRIDTGGDVASCCYTVKARDTMPGGTCMTGRPLTDGAGARCALVVEGSGWCDRPQGRWAATAAQRDEAVGAWLTVARMEHASVAAFARLTLELLSLGAPAELLADVQAAAADEVEHARLAFSLASGLAGRDLGPGPLDVADLPLRTDLVSLAERAVVEGCLGETAGAALAAEAARRATEPTAKAALQRIAADEARHAALSWRIVAWALREGGAPVRRAVEAALAAPIEGEPMAQVDGLEALGLLGPTAHTAVVAETLHAVVAPASRALLGSA